MTTHNRVIWSEGLFLQPQHFQQQERYFEHYVETRCRELIPHSWGFAEVEIRRDLLAIGKFGLLRATGVFPDGTPVRLPDEDPEPAAIDINSGVRNQIVHLAVPVRRAEALQVDKSVGAEAVARQLARELEAHDVTSKSGEPAVLEVGALRTRLLLAPDAGGAYASIPVARIIECRPDNQVVLDEGFMPTVLQVRAAPPLSMFLSELLGLLRQRGEALAGRVSGVGRGAAAELAEFLMLQVINRYEPVVAHLAASATVHPEDLYRVFVAAAGELATFTTTAKRAPNFPGYTHEALRESFEPVIAALRKSLGVVLEQAAVPLPIEPRQYGISVATVPDRTLYSDGDLRTVGEGRHAGRRIETAYPETVEDRAGRNHQGPGEQRAAGRDGRADASSAAPDSVPRRLRVLRARSERPALEQDEELGRDRYASGWRVSWSRTGVLGHSQRIGILYVGHWRSVQTTRRRDDRSAASGCGQTSAGRGRRNRPHACVVHAGRRGAVPTSRCARERPQPARCGGDAAARSVGTTSWDGSFARCRRIATVCAR